MLVAVAALAGCAAATSTETTGSTATPAPASTDPSKDQPDKGRLLQFRLPSLEGKQGDPNALNLARHGAADAPLLLFLPATNAVPADYHAFLDTAADEGYSVLGLDYWNIGKSLTVTCGPDARCYDQFQRNRFDGTSPSRFSRIDAASSVLSRLKEALTYLGEHDPRGDWTRFLTDSGTGVLWNDVVVAGHSQGGGMSAFISHYHRVQGVLMFSSPVETYQDVSAQWMETPGKTPPSRMYGFDIVTDMYADRIIPSWAKLGMGSADPAQATDVPTGSHTLLSDREVGSPREAHGRTVSDGGPRRNGGSPEFRATWQYMLRQVRSPAGSSASSATP
jgi:hypothetical protein